MTQELVLVAYAILALLSILEIVTGAKIISLGNSLSDSNINIYSIMYSAEAGFYLAAGIINLLLTGLLFALILFFTETSFLKRLAEFLAVLLVLCFQAGVAVYSAINSTVLSSQSDHFGTFPSQKCSLSSLRDLITWLAVLSWILGCPVGVLLVDRAWEQWRKSLEKQGEVQPEEPSARDSLTN